MNPQFEFSVEEFFRFMLRREIDLGSSRPESLYDHFTRFRPSGAARQLC